MKKFLILLYFTSLIVSANSYDPVIGTTNDWFIYKEDSIRLTKYNMEIIIQENDSADIDTITLDTIAYNIYASITIDTITSNEFEIDSLFTEISTFHIIKWNQTPDSVDHKELWDADFELICYLREDVSEQKVYLRLSEGEDEIVLYDFSVETNDTIPIKGLDKKLWDIEEYGDYKVTNVDSIETVSGKRKVISLQSLANSSITTQWIEGVGCLGNFFRPYYYNADSLDYIHCFFKNEASIYFADNNSTGDCEPLLVTEIGEIADNNIKIDNAYPNPFTDNLTINLNQNGNYRIQLINNLGQQVYTDRINNQTSAELNLSHLKSGIYYLMVSNGKEQVNSIVIKK